MPPGLALDCVTRLHHGGHEPRDIGQGHIEQDKIRRHDSVFLVLLLSWFFNAQIAYEPLEALLVAVVLFPAGEVSDIALTPQQASPTFRGLHHGVVYAYRKQNDILAFALLIE